MDKLKMETSDMAAENIEKIGALFPSAVTEMRGEDGSIKKGVNFEMLKQLLSPDVVEEGDERYEFTWVGKKQAIAEAARPTTKTLRPVKEDSRNWDATENLYIEGDNLEVLKILQESYLGKVKMIYIDPPYNTGHDFIYRDDFGMSREEWSEKSGELSEDGDRLFENTESNGRFHSDWCSMTYSRLMLARNLLTEDGVVFISLDDGEIENLREICNEVFGEQNFLAQCVRKRRDSQANLSKNISPIHEYVVLYAKSNGNLLNKISAHINERDYKNPDNDPRGPYKTMPCTNKGGAIYSVMTPSGKTITEEWRFKRETYDRLLNDRINHKSFYTVQFDTPELIDHSIRALDSKLNVTRVQINLEYGEQTARLESREQLEQGKGFQKARSDRESAKYAPLGSVRYDLVGKLVEETGLTRATVAAILRGIAPQTFSQFRINPEEFILKAARLINDEKATQIIEHITYNRLDAAYDQDVFTRATLRGKLDVNAMEANRSLYSHVIYDSDNERRFAQELDVSDQVAVYVKLPGSFYISTPVGKYNPDWAIAFNEGSVKHIYFVAETKGNLDTMELRGVENAKIECAKKHFAAISNGSVVYSVVDNYSTLMQLVSN